MQAGYKSVSVNCSVLHTGYKLCVADCIQVFHAGGCTELLHIKIAASNMLAGTRYSLCRTSPPNKTRPYAMNLHVFPHTQTFTSTDQSAWII